MQAPLGATRPYWLSSAVVALWAGSALIAGAAGQAEPPEPDAADILKRMSEVYASCSTYRDTGEVATVFFEGDGRRTDLKPFSTALERPDRFRFEFSHKHSEASKVNRYIIWRDGSSLKSWWDVKPGVQTPQSLALALAGATGVSSSSAHTIPALLMPHEVSGRQLTSISEAKRIEDGWHQKHDCYRIQGKYGNWAMMIWVDKEHHLVRRIDTQTQFETFRTETTTTYNPVIDEDLPNDLLAFHAPSEE